MGTITPLLTETVLFSIFKNTCLGDMSAVSAKYAGWTAKHHLSTVIDALSLLRPQAHWKIIHAFD